MSKASRAAWDNILGKEYLDYGGYKVTGDWQAINWQTPGASGRVTYYNPNNTAENFTLRYGGKDGDVSQNEELSTYLSYRNLYKQAPAYDYSGQARDFMARDAYSTGTSLGFFTPNPDIQYGYGVTNKLHGYQNDQVFTLSELAEQKRLQDLVTQYQSGNLSVNQINQMANDPSLQYKMPTTSYQQTYDATKAAQQVGNTTSSKNTKTSTSKSTTDIGGGLKMNWDSALGDIYKSRADLQELYNPDGTAKNINDSRIAGIPTLQEWAKMYGSKEYPILAGGSFSASLPTSNVSVNPSPSNTSSNLGGTPKTPKDVDALIAENAKNRTDYLSALQPTQQEIELQTQIDDILTKARNTELSAMAGIQKEDARTVPMQAIIGAQKVIQDAANLKLQTLSAQQDTITRKLELEQTKRQALLDVYKTKLQFGREDLQMAIDLAKAEKEEQIAAMEFAAENQITSPFFQVGSTIYRTSDRKPYETLEAFYKDAGVTSFAEAAQKNLIQSEFGKPVEEKHSAIYQEWKDYVYEQQKMGKNAMDFNAYQTMDANRKKSNVSVNMPSLVREYEYAQGQGFVGSLLDYTHAKSNTNTLPWEQ